jgi:MFS family permease
VHILTGLSKRNQRLYVAEAALEYLISILVTGSFLATLTKQLGFSDSLTGILSAIVSLGCLFQLFSLSVRRIRVKKTVIVLSIMNQMLFLLLYVVPTTSFSKQMKTILFVALILSAYILYNFAHPKKISWLMSLVDNKHRGSFTANKEIISLLSGMVFSYFMGSLIDRFAEAGEMRTAFSLSAITIFLLCLLHTLTMCFTTEREDTQAKSQNIKSAIADLFQDKKVLQVSLLFVIYHISTGIAAPFYGTYQIGELGLNLKFVSAMAMTGSIARILVSRAWGRYADKNSFAGMIIRCFLFFALAQGCVIFTTPKTGKMLFTLYYIFHGIALGGINSALINLIFDYTPQEKRADALAVTQAIAGLTGFLTTLVISPLVSCIQFNGNKVLGIPIFAQQFVTVLALLFTILAIIYTKYILLKKGDGKT